MVQKKYCILLKEGMHLRPAGEFCTEAAKYSCKITVKTARKEVSARSLLGVIGAMIQCGEEITLTFEGEDAEDVARSMTKYIVDRGIGKEVID